MLDIARWYISTISLTQLIEGESVCTMKSESINVGVLYIKKRKNIKL